MKCALVVPRTASGASLAAGLAAVLVPKCPACFAAYGSALAALGLGPSAHDRLVEPLLAGAVVLSVGLVWRLALRRRDILTPLASSAGAVLVLAGRLGHAPGAVTAGGAVLLLAAAVANAALCRRSAVP